VGRGCPPYGPFERSCYGGYKKSPRVRAFLSGDSIVDYSSSEIFF
jgi:hypothetical protein